MNHRPTVSVVVPFFNSERHLAACIESLLAQDELRDDDEIILIDNGSEDGSPAVAAGFDQLILLKETTPGAYAARNTGIRRATGELIAFTDADCVVDADWLRAIRDGMADPATGIMLGHCRYPEGASRSLKLLGAYENAKTEYVITRCPPSHHFGYANNMAVRAGVFAELGPFREWRRAADSELVHRLAAERPKLRLVFERRMRITHLEFVSSRQRLRRMSLYTHTNSKIETFSELGAARRFGVLLQLIRGVARGS
jgi:glycosyltransferase involved in cell wall biosynthesis